MSDLASRLRAEAQTVPPIADAGLARRIRDRLPATMPLARPHLRFPLRLAIAAALVAAVGLAWLAGTGTPPAPTPLAMTPPTPPTPPTLSEMLRDAGSAVPGRTVDGELAALGADFASVARTVRSAVPF